MVERPDVDALLAGPLGSWLAEQALVREEAKKQSANRLFKVALIGLPLLAFLWILAPIGTGFKLFVSAAAAIAGFAWSQGPKSKAKKQVKIGINEAIAGALGLAYRHDVAPGDTFELCKTYGLVPRFERAGFEDEWLGQLGAHPFRLFEAHLEEQRGSGKNRRWVTVFRGAILSIGFARQFHGTTLVERSGRHKRLFGGKKDAIELGGHRLACVDMVDPAFEDAFDIWSGDQVEARYLVHPEYVERLVGLETNLAGQDIQALFTGGALVISLKGANMFESGSIDAADDRAMIERTVAQFGSLADLADALNEPERPGFS